MDVPGHASSAFPYGKAQRQGVDDGPLRKCIGFSIGPI
jgi:hypothetical protein